MFEIDSYATIKHINPRKEGPEDAKVLALDLKLSGVVIPLDVLQHLLGASSLEEVRAAFWRDDADRNRRFLGLKAVSMDVTVENLRAQLQGVVLNGCELKRPEFTPLGGCCAELAFSLSVSDPPANALPLLAEYLGEPINIVLQSRQGDLLDEVATPAPEPAPEPTPVDYGAAHGALDADLPVQVVEDGWSDAVHAQRAWIIGRVIDNSESFWLPMELIGALREALMDAPQASACLIVWVPAALESEGLFSLDLVMPGERDCEALRIKHYGAVSFIQYHLGRRGSVSFGGSMSRSSVERYLKKWIRSAKGAPARELARVTA